MRARIDGPGPRQPVLITGGAGFIGSNLADRLLRMGSRVLILDNLSREGVQRNLDWLCAEHGRNVEVEIGDVRDRSAVSRVVHRAGFVFHLAAQVAVTTSLESPREDFDINAGGTLNILEALRSMADPPGLLFTSTNKVYGALPDIELRARDERYEPVNEATACCGVSEARPLSFHSPYGCSKGTADQYVLDYARSFGIQAVVFRMSCIYGPHQFGTEDQGWLAHFLIRAMDRQPITLYGDGRQVRDVLFIDDLVNAFLVGREQVKELSGQAFNMGGGPANTISLLELLHLIRHLSGYSPDLEFAEWRQGDQRYYVSDHSKFTQATGWAPRTGVLDGVSRLHEWLAANRHLSDMTTVVSESK